MLQSHVTCPPGFDPASKRGSLRSFTRLIGPNFSRLPRGNMQDVQRSTGKMIGVKHSGGIIQAVGHRAEAAMFTLCRHTPMIITKYSEKG